MAVAIRDNVCTNCRSIDFESLAKHEFHGWTQLMRLPWLSSADPAACSSCDFCAFLRKRDNNDSNDDRALWITTATFWSNCAGSADKLTLQVARVGPALTEELVHKFRFLLFEGIQPCNLFALIPSQPSRHHHSRRPSINFDFIKQCVATCTKVHPCRLARRKFQDDLVLIHCRTRKVVRWTGLCTFAALSYVWGTPTGESLSIPPPDQVLPADLPLVIEDAIDVCMNVGIEFLWVDRYCISEDPGEKHHQIANMDKVYAAAEVTIVAAAGQDPSYGLPGMTRPRGVQLQTRSMDLGETSLVPLMRNPQEAIMQSTWYTRAWTFQEAELSVRRLYFTDDQMVFECYKDCVQEVPQIKSLSRGWRASDGRWEQLIAEPSPLYHAGSARGHLFGNPHARDLKYLWSAIAEYSKRNLTKPDDILNGMLGILRTYSFGYRSSCFHHWGIPFPTWEQYIHSPSHFIRALDWTLEKPAPRRHGFPSWSWVGWYGAVAQKGSLPQYSSESGISRDVTVDVELKRGPLKSWDHFVSLLSAIKMTSWAKVDIRDFTPYLHLHCPNAKMTFRALHSSYPATTGGFETAQTSYYIYCRYSDWPATSQSKMLALKLTREVQLNDAVHNSLVDGDCDCLFVGGDRLPRSGKLDCIVTCWFGNCAERIGTITIIVEEDTAVADDNMQAQRLGDNDTLIISRSSRAIVSPKLRWKTTRLG